MSAKLFQCQFLGYGWTNQSIHYVVFCRQKIPNKDLSWSKSEKVYTRLYMNKLEGFSKAVATFNHVGGSFNLFMATTGDVSIIPFSNLALCAVCSAHFRCHHELWPTSVSHPFSSLSSSLCFAGGKRCQKFTIPIFRLVLRYFAIPCYFPYSIFCRYFFLIFFRLVCHCSMWLYFSQGTS